MGGKIIRCRLPDKNVRFSAFTVTDYRDLILLRNDIELYSYEEQLDMMEEIMESYFPDVPENYREYVFIHTLLSSLGKSKIPLVLTCPECGKEINFMANFDSKGIQHIEVETKYGAAIKIRFPENKGNIIEHIQDNILEIKTEQGVFTWQEISEEERLMVIDCIDRDVLEEIIKKSKPLDFSINIGCCNKINLKYQDALSIFKLCIHPEEIFHFYQVNHRLVNHKYDLNSIMKMIPIERSWALALVEKDLKNE